MDPLTIIAIVLGLGIVTVLMFFDEALDRLLNPLLSVFGLGTSIGPLAVSFVRNDSFLEMTILNNGKTKAVIAGLEIRDSQGKRFFPTPYLSKEDLSDRIEESRQKELRKKLALKKIKPSESLVIYFNALELSELDLNTLGVLDVHGKSWVVSA